MEIKNTALPETLPKNLLKATFIFLQYLYDFMLTVVIPLKRESSIFQYFLNLDSRLRGNDTRMNGRFDREIP